MSEKCVVQNVTRAEKAAYLRGYSNRAAGRWPTGWPPYPPEPVVRRLMEAVKKIRDQADAYHAMLDENDELAVTMDAIIDEADTAADAVERWLLQQHG